MIRTIYGFDDLGRKVPMGSYDDGAKAVGGRIFYIDSNSDETVEFYDAQGNVISNVAVGDTPACYKVTSAGTSGKDKYYVYSETLCENKVWGYFLIITGANSKVIGGGKSNTSLILSIEDTSAIASDSQWVWLKNANSNKLSDCSDWYIGSVNELEELRLFQNNHAQLTNFFNHEISSSSENENQGYAGQNTYGWTGTQWANGFSKNRVGVNSIPIRSF